MHTPFWYITCVGNQLQTVTLDSQIVSIDGMQVKDREHSDVVKMFQTRDDVSLVVLPARFKSVSFTIVCDLGWLAPPLLPFSP